MLPTSTSRLSSDLIHSPTTAHRSHGKLYKAKSTCGQHQSGAHLCQNGVGAMLDIGHSSELTSSNDRAGGCEIP